MVTTISSSTMKTVLQTEVPIAQESKTKTDFSLLNSVLEGFRDGVLILNQNGECVHINQEGKTICQSLQNDASLANPVPDCLLTICEHLVESQDLFPNQSLVLTQVLTGPGNTRIRAKVQWLEFPSTPDTCLLVMLENLTQSAKTTALLESVRYKLTPREQDVWLLRRANHSYEEIASKLYIAVNTVKRHLKSIHAKRKMVLEDFADSVV